MRKGRRRRRMRRRRRKRMRRVKRRIRGGTYLDKGVRVSSFFLFYFI